MGLSSLPAPSEGVFSIIIANTALSIAIFKEIVRSILHVFGIHLSPESGENSSDQFEISPFAEQFRYRIPAVRFGSFFRCPVEQHECSVCLTRFEPDSEVNRLPCGHFFHKVCLEKWLGYWNTTCPLCRTPLLADDDSTLSWL
ncbi:RING/U-box superfamily protein [Tasmannia lanceolata]|uniref:RING/U-box superfamily protein n=1 Tax=Tasmannia lanceolata TaxID=3420 RepID=UPI004063DA7C